MTTDNEKQLPKYSQKALRFMRDLRTYASKEEIVKALDEVRALRPIQPVRKRQAAIRQADKLTKKLNPELARKLREEGLL